MHSIIFLLLLFIAQKVVEIFVQNIISTKLAPSLISDV